MEREIEHKKVYTEPAKIDIDRIIYLENWFRSDYLVRLARAQRNVFLQIPSEETRFDVEKEAYEKEQEWRKLKGMEPLPEIKITEFI